MVIITDYIKVINILTFYLSGHTITFFNTWIDDDDNVGDGDDNVRLKLLPFTDPLIHSSLTKVYEQSP